MPAPPSTLSIEETLQLAKQQASAPARVRPAISDEQSDNEQDEGLAPPSEVSLEEETQNDYDSMEICVEDETFDDEICEDKIFKKLSDEDKGVRARCWFITYFTDAIWRPDFASNKAFRYAVYTREIAPTTGRIHYHCYVELNNPNTMGWLKNRLDIQTANISTRKGTVKQAIMYCTKKRTRYPGFIPVHWGKPNEQGHRTDMDWIAEAIIEGATHHELLHAGLGNVLRMGGMIRLAQETVHGVNKMDNLILARRQAAAEGRPVPLLSDTNRDEQGSFQRFVEYTNGGHTNNSESLKRALAMVNATRNPDAKLDDNGEPIKPTAGRALRDHMKGVKQEVEEETVKAKKGKTPPVKSYAKPTGAYFDKSIKGDFIKRLEEYTISVTPTIEVDSFEAFRTAYLDLLVEFIEGLIPQYCQNSKDVPALKKLLTPIIDRHIGMFLEEIEDDFQNGYSEESEH